MYCTSCGVQGTSNFCGSCGTALRQLTEASDRQQPPAGDWEQEIRYELLLQYPEVRQRLARSAQGTARGMTGEDWLSLYDEAFKPLTVIPLSTIAKIIAPIYARMGVRTGKNRRELIREPSGRMIVRAMSVLAEVGLPLLGVHQGESGCVIEARLPSDVWSFEGRLVLTVERVSAGTEIEAATNIPGQWYDWGKSTRCLTDLFSRLHLSGQRQFVA